MYVISYTTSGGRIYDIDTLRGPPGHFCNTPPGDNNHGTKLIRWAVSHIVQPVVAFRKLGAPSSGGQLL